MQSNKKNKPALKNCYALFIGIDNYMGEVPDLNGCQLDATRMHEFLQKNIDTQKYQLHSQILLSSGNLRPTRKNILEQIKTHLGQAKKDDYILFFYAGHGSTEKAPAYFGETDGNFQTLVPQDARTTNMQTGLTVKCILDKELRHLFYQIWKDEQPHFIYIQDSCHATGSNRLAEHQKQVQETFVETQKLLKKQADEATTNIIGIPVARYTMPTTDEKTVLHWQEMTAEELSLLYTAFDEKITQELQVNMQSNANDITTLFPLATQIHLAACGKQEYAYEVSPSGGVFTDTLLKVLEANGNFISYQQLLQRINLSIGGAFEQSPSLYINDEDSSKIHQPFLGDLLIHHNKANTAVGTDIFKGFFPVGYNKARGWHLTASEMLTLPRLSAQTIQQIPIEIFYQKNTPTGKANALIKHVSPQYSQFEFATTGALPPVEDAHKLVALVPPQYTRRWRAKVAIDPSIPLSIFEDTFDTKQLAKTVASGGRRKLQWVENYMESDYYVDQQGEWLALYSNIDNVLLLRAADGLAIDKPLVVIEQPNQSWEEWENNTYIPLPDTTNIRLQALPERASIVLLKILLHLFDTNAPDNSLKIGYKLPTVNLHSLEDFLAEEKKTATYFNYFINWKSFEEADYVVETTTDGWEVYPIESEEINPLPLFVQTEGFSKKAAFGLLSNLQKLTKWLTVQKLYNSLQANKFKDYPLELIFNFYQDKQKTQKQTFSISLANKEHFTDYEKGLLKSIDTINNQPLTFIAGEPKFIWFDLELKLGTVPLPLFYATLLLNGNYGIRPLQRDLGCHLLPPNQIAQLLNIKLNQPKQMRLYPASQSQATYYLKIFLGFKRFDISGLLQEPLPAPVPNTQRKQTDKKQYRGYKIQAPATGEKPGMWASFVLPIIVK